MALPSYQKSRTTKTPPGRPNPAHTKPPSANSSSSEAESCPALGILPPLNPSGVPLPSDTERKREAQHVSCTTDERPQTTDLNAERAMPSDSAGDSPPQQHDFPRHVVKPKMAQLKLFSKGSVEPWDRIKVKWKIIEGSPIGAYLAMYEAAQEDIDCYEGSVLCHDRPAGISTLVAPLSPGAYTVRLVRDGVTLALKTFQVSTPAPQSSIAPARIGTWKADVLLKLSGDTCGDASTFQYLQTTLLKAPKERTRPVTALAKMRQSSAKLNIQRSCAPYVKKHPAAHSLAVLRPAAKA